MTKGKIAVLGESHFTMGFMFAGLQDAVTYKEGGEQRLVELMDSKDYSVIFISEKLNSELDWRLKKKISNLAYPVIVALPDISGESAEGDNIRALIKRALGFDLAAK